MKTVEERKADFIRRAKEIHVGEGIDYSHVEYKDNRTPVKLIDPEYGEFWQTPANHLKGQKHPKRRGEQISKSKQFTTEEFIRRANEAHPNENLDYSKTVYRGAHEKVCIISHDLRPDGTEYGEFWQEANAHLKGCTHPEKSSDIIHANARKKQEEYISQVKKVHKGKPYSYDRIEYFNNHTPIKVYCHHIGADGEEHGEFTILSGNFLYGKGCPKCGNHMSKGEEVIYKYIESILGPNSVTCRDHSVLGGNNEIDIYIPSLSIGFEFDGIRWHSEEFGKYHTYHLNKTLKCKENGVTLFHIFEDEWLRNRDIVLSKIRNIVGGCSSLPKIPARKCEIHAISTDDAGTFLDVFHIQGRTKGTVHYGAFFNGELIGVMSFIEETPLYWNLVRYAANSTYRCQGVASKLFKHFLRENNVIQVKSFLDRRWCKSEENNLYTNLGFTFDAYTPPDYRYTNGHGERLHKFGFRKQILLKKYPSLLSPDMTETQMTEKLGYWKIWDCGLIRYIYKNGVG